MAFGFLFDDNKNKIKIGAQDVGTSKDIAPGAVGTIQLGLGAAGENFNDPKNVIVVANLNYNVGNRFAAINTGITQNLDGKYYLSVQIKNLDTKYSIENPTCHVMLMGY